MIVTESKIGFEKLKPHIVAYCDCKHFDNETFLSGTQNCASEKHLKSFKLFFSFLTGILLLKESVSVQMRLPSLKKELHEAIMKRSRLENKFLKTKLITDRKNHSVILL